MKIWRGYVCAPRLKGISGLRDLWRGNFVATNNKLGNLNRYGTEWYGIRRTASHREARSTTTLLGQEVRVAMTILASIALHTKLRAGI